MKVRQIDILMGWFDERAAYFEVAGAAARAVSKAVLVYGGFDINVRGVARLNVEIYDGVTNVDEYSLRIGWHVMMQVATYGVVDTRLPVVAAASIDEQWPFFRGHMVDALEHLSQHDGKEVARDRFVEVIDCLRATDGPIPVPLASKKAGRGIAFELRMQYYPRTEIQLVRVTADGKEDCGPPKRTSGELNLIGAWYSGSKDERWKLSLSGSAVIARAPGCEVEWVV